MSTKAPLDKLEPDFEQRWKEASHTHRNELLSELRKLYVLLEDDDTPLLTASTNNPSPMPRLLMEHIESALLLDADKTTPEPDPELQDNPPLHDESVAEVVVDTNSPAQASIEAKTVFQRRPNPFIPHNAKKRPHGNSQQQTHNDSRDFMQKHQETTAPRQVNADGNASASKKEAVLEHKLRAKLEPLMEELLSQSMETIKKELHMHLRAELDRLIAEYTRQKN